MAPLSLEKTTHYLQNRYFILDFIFIYVQRIGIFNTIYFLDYHVICTKIYLRLEVINLPQKTCWTNKIGFSLSNRWAKFAACHWWKTFL